MKPGAGHIYGMFALFLKETPRKPSAMRSFEDCSTRHRQEFLNSGQHVLTTLFNLVLVFLLSIFAYIIFIVKILNYILEYISHIRNLTNKFYNTHTHTHTHIHKYKKRNHLEKESTACRFMYLIRRTLLVFGKRYSLLI